MRATALADVSTDEAAVRKMSAATKDPMATKRRGLFADSSLRLWARVRAAKPTASSESAETNMIAVGVASKRGSAASSSAAAGACCVFLVTPSVLD